MQKEGAIDLFEAPTRSARRATGSCTHRNYAYHMDHGWGESGELPAAGVVLWLWWHEWIIYGVGMKALVA